MNGRALEGIRVVECATMVSGPYCGKLLGDMGADVIKIEPPGGDPSRACGPFPNGDKDPEKSALFLYNNTSKRGVTLDIGKPERRDALERLLRWADIFIENYPPDYFASLGFGWDAVHRMNRGLVYVSLTPYGRTGPRASIKGDELTITHGGGVGYVLPARSVDIDRAPVKLGGCQVGYHGGLTAAVAVMGLLMGRMKTGEGHLIDISLQQVMLTLVGPFIASARYHQTTWHRVPDRPPATGRMETSDGYIVLGAADDHHFRAFRKVMGKPEWAASDEWDDMRWRTNHLMDIAPQMEAWMKRQKKNDIYHRVAGAGIPIGPVNTAEDVMNSPQYAARGYFTPVDHPAAGEYRYAGWPYRMTASPPHVSRPAPLLGQHNEEVFRHVLGYSPDEVARLQDAQAIGQASGGGA